MNKKALNVVVINSDWRDIFRTRLYEMEEKLERDHLNAKVNNFFFFSWARVSYTQKTNAQYSSRHQRIIGPYFRPLYDFLAFFFVPYWVKKVGFKPDVVTTYDFGLLPAAWVTTKLHGGRVIMTINNMPSLYSATRRFKWARVPYSWMIERLFRGIPEKYFTINKAMKDYLISIGIPEEKIHVFAMNTIKRDMAYIEKSHKGRIRQKYGLKADDKIIMTVARVEAEKDYGRMIRCMAQLDDSYHFIALGRGSLMDDMKQLARELGIEKRVHFAGYVERDEIWDYYNDADIFLLLSKAEALGVVVWEAMYMHVPVIGSVAEGIIESAGEQNERGYILRDGEDAGEFKKYVAACITSGNKRDAMLAAARTYVEQQIANELTINDL